eukprot:m.454041 g.454041  ORF g.454041 m.454041 type:complete len:707 (+) comp21563_c0_seq1:114-2234(+)
MSRKVGQGLSRFAGRYPLSTTSIYPTVKSKSSDNIHRLQDAISEKVSSVYSAGLACSEVFSGPRLSSVLQDAHQLERRALACMHNDKPAPPLAVHTSGGVVPQLDSFATELRHHLPWDPDADDWFFNLQVEGTSAVLAACDTLMQLSHQKEGNRQRVKIGVASSSYHGPPVSTFGSRAVGPLGMGHAQVVYPAPTIWARCHAAETHGIHADDAFDEYMRNRFTAFLAEYGDTIGVLLIEPQWGSSVAAQPWDPDLLRWYVSTAQAHGILVCADEIMCGLGRHGRGTTFLSSAMGIDPDAVTFGKAIAAGVDPLSGAVFRAGRQALSHDGASVLQSHTYAGASARALATATSVLRALPQWHPHIAACEDIVRRHLAEPFATAPTDDHCTSVTHGSATKRNTFPRGLGEGNADTRAGGVQCHVHGQGLLWGAIIRGGGVTPKAVMTSLQQRCSDCRVKPYYVSHGCMLSPTLDVSERALADMCMRLRDALLLTVEDLSVREQVPQYDPTHRRDHTTPVIATPPRPARVKRYGGPSVDAMTADQIALRAEIEGSRTTGLAGPFGPWLSNTAIARPSQELGRVVRYETSFALRTSELAIITTARHHNSNTEWTIHAEEARKAGLDVVLIDKIDQGTISGDDFTCPLEQCVWQFATELLRTTAVSDDTYAALERHVGHAGVVELVSIVGYYTYVAYTLGAFCIPPPATHTQ